MNEKQQFKLGIEFENKELIIERLFINAKILKYIQN